MHQSILNLFLYFNLLFIHLHSVCTKDLNFYKAILFQVLRNNNTLVIFNGRESDSGRYTCEAENGYKQDTDSVGKSIF